MEVKLLGDWNGHKKGAVVKVGAYTAGQLVESELAELVGEDKPKAKKTKKDDK